MAKQQLLLFAFVLSYKYSAILLVLLFNLHWLKPAPFKCAMVHRASHTRKTLYREEEEENYCQNENDTSQTGKVT